MDDKELQSTGASGVVHRGNGVQVIYGPNVTVIKSDLEDYLERGDETNSKTRFLDPVWIEFIPVNLFPHDQN